MRGLTVPSDATPQKPLLQPPGLRKPLDSPSSTVGSTFLLLCIVDSLHSWNLDVICRHARYSP